MKKHFLAFFSGLGTAVLVGLSVSVFRNRGAIAERGREIARRGQTRGRRVAERGRLIARRGQQFAQRIRRGGEVDLNQCSAEQLVRLGLDNMTAERIIEFRPYRSKMELLDRVMLTPQLYGSIKNRVWVSGANEPVKVAG